MAAVLKHWREAASLVILAPSTRLQPSTFTGPKPQSQEQASLQHLNNNYETLLLKRSNKSTFMPNLYVFPGGTSENNDFSSEWISVFEKLGKDFQQSVFEKVTRGSSKASPMFTRFREPQFSAIPPEVAFRISAIRETFEESGILIVKKINEVEKDKNENGMLSEQWNQSSSLSSASDDNNNNLNLKEWRLRVNENPDNFLKMCKEMDLIPDITSLYEWTDWLTPTAMGGRRYDTVFYICCLENKPDTKEDSKETTHYQWISPSSILSSYYDGNVALAPPQVYELSRMIQFNSAADLMKFSADRESERVERFFPVILFTKDGIISLMPGDDLYPTQPDLYTPKHVIQSDQTMEEVNKEVKNFNRTIRNIRSILSIQFNIVFENKHIGPVTNLQKLFGKL